MTICTSYRDKVVESLQALSSEMDVVLAHENTIKDLPISKTIAAVGVKKCTISDMPNTAVDNNVKVETKERKILITVSINLYVPYKDGAKGCVSAFDKIFSCLIVNHEGDINEAKLLETKYSRETQCLAAETEFVFEVTYIGNHESSPPIVMG